MGLKVWMPLNGTFKNQGCDSGVTTTQNTASTWETTGKIGGCVTLGIQTINVPSMVNAKQLSVAYWVRVNTATSTNWLDPIRWTSTDGSSNATSRQEFYTNCTLTGVWYAGGSMSGKSMEVGKWFHYAFTIDYTNGAAKIYINGSQVGTASNVNTTHYLTGYFRIGDSGLDISECDLRIYDHILSADEIKRISKGLVIHLPLSRKGFGNDNIARQSNEFRVGGHAAKLTPSVLEDGTYQVVAESGNSNYTSSWWMTNAGIEDSFEDGDTFTISFVIRSSNANTTTPPSIYIKSGMGYYNMTGKVTANWSVVYYTGTWKKDSNSVNSHLGWSGKVGTYQIKMWKLEKGNKPTAWIPHTTDTIYSILPISSTTEYDISGYQHNATYNNITYSADAPINSMCTHFGATNAKVHISGLNVSGFNNSYSFAWWGKRDSNSPMFWGFSDGCRLNGMYLGHLWNTGDGANNPLYVPGTTTQVTDPTLNVWHHYVMTGDGTKCRVYMDGVLWAEAKTYKAISGTSIYLNGWDSGTSYCSTNTDIADFRIYATALSADDVRDLYEKR